MSKDKRQEGVERAIAKAEAGELVDRLGRRVSPKALEPLRKHGTMLQDFPEDKGKEIRRKGAEAARQVVAKRRTIREICDTLLAMDIPSLDAIADDKAREAAEALAEATGKPV